MEKADLQAGLQSLRESLRQMKSLLAWEQLKESEKKPGQPPAFEVYDPTETDIRNEFSFFLASLATIHDSLDNSRKAISEKSRQNFKCRLLKLEQEVSALNLHRRFWKSGK